MWIFVCFVINKATGTFAFKFCQTSEWYHSDVTLTTKILMQW